MQKTWTAIRNATPLIAACLLAACGAGAPDSSSSVSASTAQLQDIAQAANVSVSVVQANTNSSGQVTICHYPPGNPANMHSITVGAPAVTAHVRNHGDTIGPCGDTDAGTSSSDAGTTDADAGTTDADAGTPVTDAGVILR